MRRDTWLVQSQKTASSSCFISVFLLFFFLVPFCVKKVAQENLASLLFSFLRSGQTGRHLWRWQKALLSFCGLPARRKRELWPKVESANASNIFPGLKTLLAYFMAIPAPWAKKRGQNKWAIWGHTPTMHFQNTPRLQTLVKVLQLEGENWPREKGVKHVLSFTHKQTHEL